MRSQAGAVRESAQEEQPSQSGARRFDSPVVIEPSRRWRGLDLSEVWAYRELFFFLAWGEIKVRYKQTVLGMGWAVIQPLFYTLVFTAFLSHMVAPKTGAGSVPYPLSSYVALLPWTFFSAALTRASTSILGNSHIISKVYFPRLIIPGSSILACLVDFAIAIVFSGVLLAYYRVAPSLLSPLFVVLLTALTSALALGLGLWLGALSVRFRDIKHGIPFLVQLWMFATPVAYTLSSVPEKYRWLSLLNPMTGITEGFRSALLDQPWNLNALAISASYTLVLLTTGVVFFRTWERTFTDLA